MEEKNCHVSSREFTIENNVDGMTLFCLPSSGSSNHYSSWMMKFADVNIQTVELSTLGSQAENTSWFTSEMIAAELLEKMRPRLERPYSILGHSAGGIMAIALVERIQKAALPMPHCVMVCGPIPPSKERMQKQLVNRDISIDSSDKSLLDDQMNRLILDAADADLNLLKSFIHVEPELEPRFSVPFHIFSRDDDALLPTSSVSKWQEMTLGQCKIHVFSRNRWNYPDESTDSLVARVRKILTEDLYTEGMHRLNNTTMPYPDTSCLHDLFVEAVQRSPDATAVVYEAQSLSFRQVDILTDKLAGFLYASGVRANKITAIFMEHCSEFVLAYIAALKAGGAYMPLEIVYPTELVERVITESSPVMVLTKEPFSERLPAWQSLFLMDAGWDTKLQNIPVLPSDRPSTKPDDLAYVVMSSGSTGTPKGICCPHRGAIHSYHWRLTKYPFQEGERIACHVFFVWELLRPLLGNVPMYIIPDNVIYDPHKLAIFISDNLITRILFTPSLLQLILDTLDAAVLRDHFRTLQIVWLCGEVVTMELRNLFVTLLPTCRLLNLYSISECHDVSAVDLATIDMMLSPKFAPCGDIIDNVRVHIYADSTSLDSPLPIGSTGEVYVGGPCLANGYLNNETETKKRFIKCPRTNERIYRTGDRGRILPNGQLELVGRCDYMVKVRGYSVMLGAVEATISDYSRISTCMVVTEGNEGEDKRLVAYVVPSDWNDVPSAYSIRSFLKGKLPHYAIPSVYVSLDALPICSKSGKLDRKSVGPSEGVRKLRAYSEKFSDDIPSTPLELTIAGVWGGLLKVDVSSISLSDSFFEIGGHSLLATRLASHLRDAFNVKYLVSSLLQAPSLREVCESIARLQHNDEVEEVTDQPKLDLEVSLQPSVYPAATRKSGYARYRLGMITNPPRHVFLTGTTGFLGAHILADMLKTTDAVAFCLVRAEDEHAGSMRIKLALEKYDLWMENLVERIIPVVGTLSEPLLGLSSERFRRLAGEVDAIIHAGAEVNLVKPYASLKPPNVLGTHEVLRLAVTNGWHSTRVKPVHYISTNGVFPPKMDRMLEKIQEEWELLRYGYAQSKWVGEMLCLEARQRGLPVSIMRPGNMAPSSSYGRWNESDFIYLLLKSCKYIHAVPTGTEWNFDLTPVDFAARSIVYLAVQEPRLSLGQIFHIQNPDHPISADAFFALCGKDMQRLPLVEWKLKLEEAAAVVGDSIPYVERLLAGFESFDTYLSKYGIFSSEHLTKALNASGILCPSIDQHLIDSYMRHV